VNEEEIRQAVLDAVHRVAPDVDVGSLDSRGDLREQADLDSVDVLNIVVRLHETLGVDVPETDYEKMTTLDGAVAYLAGKLGG
jgi:acyl carrier protein